MKFEVINKLKNSLKMHKIITHYVEKEIIFILKLQIQKCDWDKI